MSVKLLRASPTSFSGKSGLESVDSGDAGDSSFGGGAGGLSAALSSGLSGSNCRRMFWREASRLCFGLGGGGGGEARGDGSF